MPKWQMHIQMCIKGQTFLIIVMIRKMIWYIFEIIVNNIIILPIYYIHNVNLNVNNHR